MHRPLWGFLAAVLVAGLGVQAAGKKKAKQSWEKKRDQIYKQVEQRLAAELNKRVDPRRIARYYHWEYPPKPPTMSPKEVKAAVEKKIRQMVDAKYPLAGKETQYRKEAEAKYKLHKIGDHVSFIIRGGRGTNTLVEGRFDGMNEVRIKVGNRWIVREDMDVEDLARFDPVIHKRYIKRYVRFHLNTYKVKRVDYAEQLRKKIEPQMYQAANYVIWGRRWVPVKPLLDMIVAWQRKQWEKRLRPRIEKELFTKNGFVKFKGKWMPKKNAESLKAKLAELLEARKKQAAAAKSANEMFGGAMMPGGMGGKPGMMMGEGGMPGMMGPGGKPGMMGGGAGMPGMPGGGKEPGMMGGSGMPGMMGRGGMPPGMMPPGGGKNKKK